VTDYPEIIEPNKSDFNRILAVGRLNHQKGFDKLIEAFSLISNEHPSWHIDIFGHGELQEELQIFINNKGLNNNITINPPKEDIYNEYLSSSFYVLSSSFEGLPLVLIEAMSCALPCVSFDCPYGPSEIIADGIDGLLVKNGDVKDLAQKMDWMITHPKERNEMALTARKNAERYKIDNIMRKWISLFTSLISSNSN
jgi:glycosyltransferase involved in cell wall biosynthesis